MHPQQSTSICDTKYKIVFLGDMGVGKTSIIDRFIRNSFDDSNNPTVGIDFMSKNLTINNHTYRLQLWDTAGQQKYKSLIPAYLKDANAAIFVYDVTRKQSLQDVRGWIQLYRQHQKQNSLAILVGTKIDLAADNNPLGEAAESLAQEQLMIHTEVSSKSGYKVAKLFSHIVQALSIDKKPESVAVTAEQREAERIMLKLQELNTLRNRFCCYI